MPASASLNPIAVRGVSKRFGSTAALTDISLEGRAGSIHAITGENGAGKSTLMKLLAGVHRPDVGQIVVNGRPTVLPDPMASRRAGISTVFQELTVLPNLTVGENLMLGREPRRYGLLDRARMHTEAREVLARIGIDLDPRRGCDSLSVGEQQLVEIAKGVSAEANVFIFDEPTAALNRKEVDKLEALLHDLKAQRKLVFYISHRLDEIFRLCDTVTVLKDGCHVATEPVGNLDTDRLITLMVGRPLQALFPARRSADVGADAGADPAIALDVRRLTTVRNAPSLGLRLHRGEIVGLGGIEGQGQREIIRCLAGAMKPHDSDIWKPDPTGAPQHFDPAAGVVHAVARGVGLIPEDRKLEGLYLDLPIVDNIGLGRLRGRGLWRRAPRLRSVVEQLAGRMQLRARDLQQEVGALSGGNQQKVMLGRWLAAGVDTLLVEQPTRGVDVGAKAEIYALLREFVDQGGTVLAVSGDLLELIGLCDRILVVRGGAIVGDVEAQGATEESLLALALADAPPTVGAAAIATAMPT